MPFSSGTFSRIYNWVNEQLSSPIEISKLDTQEEDIATALSNCILRDGTGLPTAAQNWNGQNLTNVAAFTATGIVTGGRFVPTSSSAPTNGMYLSAANTPALASNSTLRWSVNSTGNHTIAAPSSGTALTVNGPASGQQIVINAPSSWGGIQFQQNAVLRWSLLNDFDAAGEFSLYNHSRGASLARFTSAGNVTIAAPSSGTALTVSGAVPVSANDRTITAMVTGGDARIGVANGAGGNAQINLDTTGVQNWAIANRRSDGALVFSAAQDLSVVRMAIASAGNVTINAPSSGTPLSVNGVDQIMRLGTTGDVTASGLCYLRYADTNGNAAYVGFGGVASGFDVVNQKNGPITLYTNNTARMAISGAGNVTINAPSSGVGMTVAGGGATITGTVAATAVTGDGSGLTSLNATQLTSGTVPDARFPATLPAISGANLTNLSAGNLTGTVASARISGSYTGITAIGNATALDDASAAQTIGWRDMPQNATTSVTLALSDRGKHIYANTTTSTVTIPANASVAFPVGSTIVLINDGSGNMTVQITTDTLAWLQGGAESTGTRTVATKSVVTLVKVGTTRWIISGSGIS